ncbi:hypothetical protein A5780_34520 [Nocardia sp. 852002-20019_SCH5090214]|nr:hypothetical protein A5780_34520 [Nocardia sp. 852002-20019_SCH5090214]
MVAVVAEQGSTVGRRRSQEIARARSRRRRPNITGPKRTLEVTVSEEEYARIKEAADEAGATVPWYLVDSTLNPPAATTKPGRKSGPWLPWPKRKALADAILSGASALSLIVLRELSHTEANINQIARAVNITEVAPEELPEVLAELQETMAEIRDLSERMEAMAKEVVRR